MPKYILHGGNTSRDNELNQKFFLEIANSLDSGDKILMCFFAPAVTSGRTEQYRHEHITSHFESKVTDKKFDFVFAKREKFVEQLKEADALYIHGGETEELYKDLQKYSDFKNLIETKKLIIGSSAGAYVLGEYSIDYAEKSEVKKRFGILPIVVFCHFTEDRKAVLDEKFNAIDPEQKFERVFIPDCDMRIINQ